MVKIFGNWFKGIKWVQLCACSHFSGYTTNLFTCRLTYLAPFARAQFLVITTISSTTCNHFTVWKAVTPQYIHSKESDKEWSYITKKSLRFLTTWTLMFSRITEQNSNLWGHPMKSGKWGQIHKVLRKMVVILHLHGVSKWRICMCILRTFTQMQLTYIQTISHLTCRGVRQGDTYHPTSSQQQ